MGLKHHERTPEGLVLKASTHSFANWVQLLVLGFPVFKMQRPRPSNHPVVQHQSLLRFRQHRAATKRDEIDTTDPESCSQQFQAPACAIKVGHPGHRVPHSTAATSKSWRSGRAGREGKFAFGEASDTVLPLESTLENAHVGEFVAREERGIVSGVLSECLTTDSMKDVLPRRLTDAVFDKKT